MTSTVMKLSYCATETKSARFVVTDERVVAVTLLCWHLSLYSQELWMVSVDVSISQ